MNADRILQTMFLVMSFTLPGRAAAMCAATTSNLVEFGVWTCQEVTIGADRRNPELALKRARVQGVLISGIVLQSRSVLRDTARDLPVFPGARLPENKPASLFMAVDSDEVCREFSATEPVWLVTALMCCDTLPKRGLCLVPDTIPIVEKAEPEDWRKYTAPEN